MNDYIVETENGAVITAQYKPVFERWAVYLGDCLINSQFPTRADAVAYVDELAKRH